MESDASVGQSLSLIKDVFLVEHSGLGLSGFEGLVLEGAQATVLGETSDEVCLLNPCAVEVVGVSVLNPVEVLVVGIEEEVVALLLFLGSDHVVGVGLLQLSALVVVEEQGLVNSEELLVVCARGHPDNNYNFQDNGVLGFWGFGVLGFWGFAIEVRRKIL